jgi:predicted O-methyltransferase YrrM
MSTNELDVDHLLQSLTFGEDPYAHFNAKAAANDIPPIQVAPVFGRLLQILTELLDVRVALEIGTLAGYSAAWIAAGLSKAGRLISLELEPRHAQIARENLASVGLDNAVDIRVGSALDTLPGLHDDPAIAGHVDLSFIDADKASNAAYLEHAVELSRPGALIIVDNVVRQGEVLDATSTDPNVVGTRQVLSLLGSHPRLRATALQTVGLKGHDGFAAAIVLP